ncbi:IclR family transcriptional regulator C-terminal domain-containing protein [Deinococcus sp. QL22]|uniref:IclR family transcriptional regulator domain-containing protein n=1 Tax=Deinococcus sp. QL22 TaxID=2939437 RepID=UPI0020177A4A|nr:IclR family transcriptional regulator C-terminal domain-containing protein [Deinococcus sp. QL22]UQN10256.1 helix-turn-helix domain-containing protein [Deinococcus sp. QL22]
MTPASVVVAKPSLDERSGETIQALTRGLQVIRAFDARHQRMTLTEVAAQTNLTRATARRCLLTLHHLGYVAWDGKFFTLTPKILTLGYAYLSSTSLPMIVQPALVHLSEQSGASCSACILDGDEAVIVARASAQRFNSTDLGVGSRLPLYCTSLGHILLAEFPSDELERYLQMTVLMPHTPRTLTHPDDVRAAVDRTRAAGYALNAEGLESGLRSISVPLRNTSGQVVAALSATLPVGHGSENDLQGQLLPLLRGQATLLQQMLSA